MATLKLINGYGNKGFKSEGVLSSKEMNTQ
jgi:hypothetical protein